MEEETLRAGPKAFLRWNYFERIAQLEQPVGRIRLLKGVTPYEDIL